MPKNFNLELKNQFSVKKKNETWCQKIQFSAKQFKFSANKIQLSAKKFQSNARKIQKRKYFCLK